MNWTELSRNRLLATLPAPTLEAISTVGTTVPLPLGTVMSERDSRPQALYFLFSGVTSIVFTSVAGTTIEQSTEGSEGLIGWAELLGPSLASSSCTMQIAGEGLRVPYPAMQVLFEQDAELQRRVLEFGQFQHLLTKQVLACNRLHRAEARFSRWLLMLSDRIGSDTLPTTQEFLSNMLGTRRTTVAEMASQLGKLGALEGRRGALRILNRTLLEKRACECYGLIKSSFDALYTHDLAAAKAGSRNGSS